MKAYDLQTQMIAHMRATSTRRIPDDDSERSIGTVLAVAFVVAAFVGLVIPALIH